MKRLIIALLAGIAFVGLAAMLGHTTTGGRIAYVLLWPGLMLGALAPDSGYGPEGDMHPWGPISRVIMHGANVALYTGLAYLLLSLVARLRASK